MLRNRTEQYWISGLWNAQYFSLVPEMMYLKSNDMFNISHVSNENESYFTYSVAAPITFQFVMDASGQVQQMYWLETSKTWFQFWSIPRNPCEVYAYCGAFGSCREQNKPFCDCLSGFKPNSEHDWNLLEDYSGGCQRKSQLQCENSSLVNGKSDKFMATSAKELPKHLQSTPVANIKQCETSCLNNCACIAYAYENNRCSIWIGSLLNLQQLAVGDTDGKTIYIKLAAYEFSSPRNDKRKFIDGVVGSVAFVLLLGLLVVACMRWKKRTFKKTKATEGSLVAFSYKELQKATKNFSERLGGGGFGSVFKGLLPDSSVIAVKRLESISQGEKQFRTEVTTMGNINHVNLVRLLGFCSEDTRLAGNADIEELLRICRVACWCIQDDETQRPSMGEVVQKLEGVLDVTQSPIPRSIQAYSHYQDHIIFFTASSSSSNQSPHSQNNNPSAASS
ncbi:hypothetical protein Patl1_02133 [Pistacia atlantica]|uniref:Uncharacterized protein n=1 Tax=Pistacia atlantica TaxID=434234 RepID=A0ACC1C6Q4_9ROSI|nr:hypothetical protein Patl1_02133 [Pistacia atlantica]